MIVKWITPEGAIKVVQSLQRPVVVLSVLGLVGYGFVAGKIPAEVVSGAFGIIVGFLFGERSALKNPGKDN